MEATLAGQMSHHAPNQQAAVVDAAKLEQARAVTAAIARRTAAMLRMTCASWISIAAQSVAEMAYVSIDSSAPRSNGGSSSSST